MTDDANDETPLFNTVGVIGTGLIGGSLARAIRANGLAARFIGYDQEKAAAERAVEIGIIDRAGDSVREVATLCDLIIVSTPVGVMASVLQEAAEAAHEDAIIIDVGSVKGSVVQAAEEAVGGAHIVPCHPVSGTEQSGPDAGFATLFEKRWCILTPLPLEDEAYAAAVEKTAALWLGVGAEVEVMDAAHHDLALAVTSHLPHLIAFTLVGAADDLETVTEAEIVKYSAGGFRDFTRIAASNPVMWRDVFLNNKDAVLEVLGRFSEELAILQRAIRWGDQDMLMKSFTRGAALRRAIVEAGQETDVPNFGRDHSADNE